MESRTEYSNIPPSIDGKLGRALHNVENHPINICKNIIYGYFESLSSKGYSPFKMFDTLSPVVSVDENFDKLLIPVEHPSRSKSDTYYINKDTVLRTHTSAHQYQLLKDGHDNFLVTGDVYRKDEIDATHYPVFHQMEGLAKLPDGVDAIEELKKILSGLVETLFPGCEYRFNDDYFPFTDPSLEVEVMYNGKWLEILGCGVTQRAIIKSAEREGTWWAFGLGLERICMVLFNVPDIRYFWSADERFLKQFTLGEVTKFKAFSTNLETEIKDISFWIDNDQLGKDNVWYAENDFMDIVRNVCGDWVENVEMIDSFTHKKTGRHSKCYRLKLLPIDTKMVDPGIFKDKCISMMTEIKEKLAANDDIHIEIR
jgi:phenylalanyl-tRNA synthetase alpha chain